ncbi:DUF3037 domain-containing protein [Chondromyces crocatus]|uniref:Uncharacterized protein n=1 Tax=Chondromyces crocatus TaxID=52 RepID=A0A0K1ECH7_CHOCO|nr:DUF3037 domain-containing protein [Chondromyces crocatus]AKT38397.1 uncharacterized protein CMC5_025430 [Chondromyces crocatus]
MASWSPTTIRWVSDPLASSTGAARVQTDQGPAYAKLLGNPEGPLALFCDWLGTHAAAWLGLPTFDLAVVEVTEPALVTYADGSTSCPGPALLARLEHGTTWGGTSDELAAIENPDIVSGLVVLDTWLLNSDRYRPEGAQTRKNLRNVFLSAERAAPGKHRLLAMDHTHAFACSRPLTTTLAHRDRARDARLYGHFPEFAPYLAPQHLAPFAARLRAFDRQLARRLLSTVPTAWRPTPDLVEAVATFLAERAHFLAENVHAMLAEQGHLLLRPPLAAQPASSSSTARAEPTAQDGLSDGQSTAMRLTRGFFSLLQFCPDLDRGECANVGVVLSLPERGFFGVRLSDDNRVPQRRFGRDGFDDARLTLAKRALEGRLRQEGPAWRSADDLLRFARKEGNHLILSAPRTVLLEDPRAELNGLYERLVHLDS